VRMVIFDKLFKVGNGFVVHSYSTEKESHFTQKLGIKLISIISIGNEFYGFIVSHKLLANISFFFILFRIIIELLLFGFGFFRSPLVLCIKKLNQQKKYREQKKGPFIHASTFN